MLESVSDGWADSRPPEGTEFLGYCLYCSCAVYADDDFANRHYTGSTTYVHLVCEDAHYLEEQ